MGKTYYDCPCCEREVWVHSFWGAAWDGAVCHACRDDHGNCCTSNCYVDGPAKRRREQKKRDEARDEARRLRDAYERERTRLKLLREKQEQERIQNDIKEREKLRKKQEEETRIRREKEKREQEEMKQLLDKQIADKQAAAQKIRDKINKLGNPFKDFKTMQAHAFIKKTAERVTEMGAAGEILEKEIGNIKTELQKSLGDEFSVVQSEFLHYQTYANDMKSLTDTFITEFGKVFADAEQKQENISDCLDEVFDDSNDSETRSDYQIEMGININKLCGAADEMSGQLEVMDAYYDKMISDGDYFEKFLGKIHNEHSKDLLKDKTIKTLVEDFKNSCLDDRLLDDGMDQTIFEVEYESKTYKRNANSVWDSVKNTVSDNTRKACSAIGDVAVVTSVGVASTVAIGGGVVTGTPVLVGGGLMGYDYLSTRKSLYGSCIKKIENEKYDTTTQTVSVKLKQEFYDGTKHKEVLERFTNDMLKEINKPLKTQVRKYKDMKEAAKRKNEEMRGFKQQGIMEMKTHIEKFRKDAHELKKKLNSKLPLKEVDCKLLKKKWTSMQVNIGSLIETMKNKKNKMKDVENIKN